MIRAMRTAATGMKAQQMNVDNIANNLANVNTTGFKKSRVEFQDLFYQRRKIPGSGIRGSSPAALELGYGSSPVATQRMYTQGEVHSTGNPTDVAIMGDGFFRVVMPDGTESYTRDGSLRLSVEGQLITSDGYMLDPGVAIPPEAQQIEIAPDGVVTVILAGDTFPQEVGQLETVRFVNPTGLLSMGRNMYRATAASGEAIPGTPNMDGYGRLAQGHLEFSNVEVVDEMIALIAAQRAYEINSKAIKAAEDMMTMANDLTR